MPDNDAIIHPVLLDALLRRRGVTVLSDVLLEATSLSSRELPREIRRLVDAGCVLEEHPQQGVRLATIGLSAWADYVKWRCPPRHVEVYRTTGSTQDRARALVESLGVAAHGAVITAEEQTAGRGRMGRRWIAPAGKAVTFTMVNLSNGGRVSVDQHMLATSIAIARAVEAVTKPSSVECRIKWPNDVMVDGRKLAGILVETFTHTDTQGTPIRASIIGVGVNVSVQPGDLNDPTLRDRITSLSMLSHHVEPLDLLCESIMQMDMAFRPEAQKGLLDEWRRRCTILSQRMEWESDGRRVRGHVLDLDPIEGLVVRTDSGTTVHLPAATTTVVR